MAEEEEDLSPDSELQTSAKEMSNHLWTDSLWQTYQESVDVIVPDPNNPDGPGQRITRKLSMGMSVKSDNRAPAKILQFALSRSLNGLMEEEKERWLDGKAMEAEVERIRRRVGNGQTTEEGGTESESSGEGVPVDTEVEPQGTDTDDSVTG